jgi:hypothetical protein
MMTRLLIPALAILVLGCARSTEALPFQANDQPRPETKRNDQSPMLGFSVPSVQANAKRKQDENTVQDEELKKKPDKDKEADLPRDKGSKLVADLLRPADKSLVDELSKKRISGPASLEHPEITAPAYKGLPPKLAVKAGGKAVRPKPAAEGIPFSGYFADPQLPVVVKLEGAALVKWPMPDPKQPTPLPILAQQRPDRAPLIDPTADASIDAALSGITPGRDNPAPFLRVNLPDPFENRQTIKVRNPLPEDPTPQTR